MRILFLLFCFLVIVSVQYCRAGSGWEELNSGTTSGFLGVYFLDESRGYAVGDVGTILKTTNGGSSWANVAIPTQVSLWGVYAAKGEDGDILYVAGDDGTVYKTVNGGLNWLQQDVHYTQGFTFSVYCSNPTTCFVTGGEGTAGNTMGTIVRTTDGGNTWTKTTLSGTYSFDKVYSPDGMTGYAVGSTSSDFSSGAIYKTTDGGASWTLSMNTPGGMNAAYCSDGNHCIAVGFFGLMYTTADGGKNWTKISLPYFNALLHIAFLDQSVGIATGDNGLILMTMDGGETWSRDNSFTGDASLWGLSIIPGAGIAYAVGDGGTIIKKTISTTPVKENGGEYSGMFVRTASESFAGNSILFGIPKPGYVHLELFSLDGRSVLTLTDGLQEAGEHNATIKSGSLQSGVYLCRLTMGDMAISTTVRIVR